MKSSFKYHYISYVCPVLNTNVKLKLSYLEYSIKGNNSPSGIVDCDHIEKCGVKSNDGICWKKCPLIEKRF